MKKRTSIIALGIILSSQLLPVMAHADSLRIMTESAEAPPLVTEVVEKQEDSEGIDIEEMIDIPVTITEEKESETIFSTLEAENKENRESLDNWMPDENLQRYVARSLEISVEEITKEIIQQANYIWLDISPLEIKGRVDELSMEVFPNGVGTLDLTGLEYAQSVEISAVGLTEGTLFNTDSLVGKNLDFYCNIENHELENYEPIHQDPLITEFGIYDLDSLFSTNLLNTNENVSISIDNFGEFISMRKKIEKTVTPDSYEKITIANSDIFNFQANDKAIEIEKEMFCDGDEFFITNQNGNKLVYTVTSDEGEENLELTLKSGIYEPGVYTTNGGEKPINPDSDIWRDDEEYDSENDFNSLLYTRIYYREETSDFSTTSGGYLSLNLLGQGTVSVNYIDENENILAEPILLSGIEGESYQTASKTFEGYTLKEVKGNESGSFNSKEQSVTYVYQKNEEKIKSEVIVNYLDEEGDKVSDTLILIGHVGENYQTEQKEILGYHLKEIKGNERGFFESTAQSITYVYAKDIGEENSVEKDEPLGSEDNKVDKTPSEKSNMETNLPKTGSQSSVFPFFIGSLLIGTGTLIFAFRKKK